MPPLKPIEPQVLLERTFVSEVFHELSQPLAALQFTLEQSLQREQDAAQLRTSLAAALEQAERLRNRLLQMRALTEAYDPGDAIAPVDVNQLLQQLHEDLLPLFLAGVKLLEIVPSPVPVIVMADRLRLMRALFCFLEFLCRYSQEGDRTSIWICLAGGDRAEVRISSEACLPLTHSADNQLTHFSFEIEVMRRTWSALGGSFELESASGEPNIWRALLPLTEGK